METLVFFVARIINLIKLPVNTYLNMRKIYCLICILSTTLFFAQNNSSEKDSLAFMKLLTECNATCGDDTAFKKLFPNVLISAEKINKPFSLGKTAILRAIHNFQIGKYDSSNFYFDAAMKALDGSKLYSSYASCLAGKALNYGRKGDEKTHVNLLLEYLNYSKKNKLPKKEADAYSRLGNAFDLDGKPELSIKYLYLGIELAKKNDLKVELADLYNMLATGYYSLYAEDSNYTKKSLAYVDSSERYFSAGIAIANEIGDSIELGRIYNNISGMYEYKKDYKKVLESIQKSLAISKAIESEYLWSEPYSNMSLAYINLKDFKNAKLYLDTAITIAKKYNNNESLLSCYENGIVISKNENNYSAAYQYLEKKTLLNDSIYGTETSNKVSELEIQYQTKEKENTITNQKLKLEQRNKTILLISIVALLLAIAGWLYYRSYKSKNALAFEQQQQRASLMVIESEQTERMRIARELHDGIGQKLTVLKMYASAEKEKNEKQLDLLDTTIQEVREISHKMIPEILSLGLIAAVKDLCYKVNIGGTIECSFACDETSQDLKLAENINLSIYRIVQEIINNMLKHANAKTIQVKFITTGDNLQITVNDDGKGFDVKKIKQSSGIGWSNIFTRASIIKAAVDVNSSEKGTHITLNLNI
jgi:two-component system, NarL family, sensor kinase